ncbi:MAG: hypothetical protein RBS27_15080 [Giesbergeria sp.]|jgi:hypothetical protein|nr:hypothetical protein [Giesbergeria sp.]
MQVIDFKGSAQSARWVGNPARTRHRQGFAVSAQRISTKLSTENWDNFEKMNHNKHLHPIAKKMSEYRQG